MVTADINAHTYSAFYLYACLLLDLYRHCLQMLKMSHVYLEVSDEFNFHLLEAQMKFHKNLQMWLMTKMRTENVKFRIK